MFAQSPFEKGAIMGCTMRLAGLSAGLRAPGMHAHLILFFRIGAQWFQENSRLLSSVQ